MSQEIDSLNHSDEHESEDDWNTMSDSSNHSDESIWNRTLGDVLAEIKEKKRREKKIREKRRKYGEERRKNREIYLPLYQASIRCDWKAAKAILDENPNMGLVRCSITENGETALHIAASAKAPKENVDEFVKNLVLRMTPEDLKLVNNNHSTALYLAAVAGNIETVKIMMNKNPILDTIRARKRMMPLYAAVLFGNKDVVEYLYKSSEELTKDGWNKSNRSQLLEKCVESDMFDIAIQIVKKYPELGWSSYLLGVLARKPELFHEKKSSNTISNIISRTIKSVSASIGYKAESPAKKSDALALLKFLWEDIVEMEPSKRKRDNILKGPRDSIMSGSGRIVQTLQLKKLILDHLEKLADKATQTIKEGTPTCQEIKDLVSTHVLNMHVETQSLIKQDNTTDEDQALDLQKLISKHIVKLHHKTKKIPTIKTDYQKAQTILKSIFKEIKKMRDETNKIDIGEIRDTRIRYSSRVMFIAAEAGNTNFLVELIRRRPDIIWQVDDNGLSIFHVAVKHRHEGIYNLLYAIGSMKDMVTTIIDKDENNMLHLAAMRTRKKNLEDVSGAALQMQRELLWFKEVERMIPPYLREKKNKNGFTPRELFTMEHEDLVEKGEKWMKETASQWMVVATLIATIVFAAAFTVPGGYNQNDGIPMFKRKLSFVSFVVADAISLVLSSASILTFLSILTSSYAERDFVAALPMKLMLGLVMLFFSIGTMMITFSVSFFVLYHKEMKWIPIFISVFSVIPTILYVVLQYQLLVDVVRSAYGGKYLFKPEKQVLFYCEKPQDPQELTHITSER